jgi:hypothetical protein
MWRGSVGGKAMWTGTMLEPKLNTNMSSKEGLSINEIQKVFTLPRETVAKGAGMRM